MPVQFTAGKVMDLFSMENDREAPKIEAISRRRRTLYNINVPIGISTINTQYLCGLPRPVDNSASPPASPSPDRPPPSVVVGHNGR